MKITDKMRLNFLSRSIALNVRAPFGHGWTIRYVPKFQPRKQIHSRVIAGGTTLRRSIDKAIRFEAAEQSLVRRLAKKMRNLKSSKEG